MPKRKPSQRRHPEKTPQQPRDRLAEIRAEIQAAQQQIETKRRDGRVIRTAEDFESLERAIAALTNRLSALLMAEATQVALDDSENRRQARSLAQGAGHTIKDQGRRDVTLRTTCGQVIVRATYFSRNCDRSKASKGMDPMLLLWGVQDRCTAAIVSEISKLVAMLSSLEEVEQVLSDRGRPLDYRTIRTIAYRFATRARAAQRVGALNWGETVAGRRVVVSTDGGRIRIRTTKRGPKTAKGRNRYRTDWREPKLLIIYVVDEKGQMDREFLTVIDGTLGGPDAIFKLLEFYFRELKISTADKILFVADGARWIWNRVGALRRRLGVKPDQVNELVDFYHTVGHLGKIAALQRHWTAAERQAWIGRQRRRLRKGGAEDLQRYLSSASRINLPGFIEYIWSPFEDRSVTFGYRHEFDAPGGVLPTGVPRWGCACWPSGSSLALTSTMAGWSRERTSSTSVTPAIRWRSRRGMTPREPMSWFFSTSPPATKSARSSGTWSGGRPRSASCR